MKGWPGAMVGGFVLCAAVVGCGGDTDRDTGQPGRHLGSSSGTGGSSGTGAATAGATGSGGVNNTGGDASGGTHHTGGTGTGGVESTGGNGNAGGSTAAGAAGSPAAGGAPQAGTGGEAGDAGAGARGGAAGAGGTPLPGLCQLVSPRPPGCPCTNSSECDGMCLALPSDEPCELATTGLCANPPNGGCVCELGEDYTGLLCIELQYCPEARPSYPESCGLLAHPCDYDTPAHERCWCMDRFGEAVWECAREDAACPYIQPTPESPCTGDIDCFFATVSSLAYRCTCTNSSWDCEMVSG